MGAERGLIAARLDDPGTAMRSAFNAVHAVEDTKWSRQGSLRSNGLDHVVAGLERINEAGDTAAAMNTIARCRAIAAAMSTVASLLESEVLPALPSLRPQLVDGEP